MADTTPPPPPAPVPMSTSVMSRLRNYFLAGILVTAPIAITLYFAWSVIDYVDSFVDRLIREAEGIDVRVFPN